MKFYEMKLNNIECGWKDQLDKIIEEEGKRYSPKKVYAAMIKDYGKIAGKMKEIINRGIKTSDLKMLLQYDILLYILYLDWIDCECNLEYNGVSVESITPDMYDLYFDLDRGIQEYKLFN